MVQVEYSQSNRKIVQVDYFIEVIIFKLLSSKTIFRSYAETCSYFYFGLTRSQVIKLAGYLPHIIINNSKKIGNKSLWP